MTDYYAELGLPRDATHEAIRRAYHQAALRLHPDVNLADGATEAFIRAQSAFEVLSDPQKKAEYDAGLPEPPRQLVEVALDYSRSSIIHMDEIQILYALLQFSAPAGGEIPAEPPLNVCLVLDHSTSMKGARLDVLKATAIELLRQARPEDSLSIVAFSDRAETLHAAGRRCDIRQVETYIQMLQPKGATEILRGLEAGFFEVRRNLSPDRINHLILITDGHTYGDEPACLELAAQANAVGVGISSLGIGHEWNDVFLENLAALTGGSTSYISRPEEIKHFLKQKLQRLSQVYAERITLEGRLSPGVELGYAFRISPDAAPLPAAFPTQMGTISREAPLSVLFEFAISPISTKNGNRNNWNGEPDLSILDGIISFDIPGQKGPSSPIKVRLDRPVRNGSDDEAPPPILVQALSRLTLYRMQERARRALARGDVESATRHLQHLATHLFSRGESDLAHAVLVEVEQVEKNHAMSEEGGKRLKYGTRALLLPYNSTAGEPRGSGGGANWSTSAGGFQ